MEKFSVAKVAQILDLSTATIKRWYKWYENPDYRKPPELKLPPYTLDNRRTMLFEQKDIAKLQQFHEDLQGKYKGCMAEFNAYWQWGKYGTKRLEKMRRMEAKDE